MKYRKKPVVVEAMQFTGTPRSWERVGEFVGQHAECRDKHVLIIHTLEGEHRADVGDWIIKGVIGEFYPCKPDIFAQTYEPVDGESERERMLREVGERMLKHIG